MISGNNERPISKYILIDHVAEGYGYVTPKEGETFWGIPYGWHGQDSFPFIEIRKSGNVTATINALDVSEIHFL